MKFETLRWTRGRLRLIDQRKLPQQFVYLDCDDHKKVAYAIKNLVVRGAPAIGVAAGYGMALAAREYRDLKRESFFKKMKTASETLASTRPTAVNLFWALNRQDKLMEGNLDKTPSEIFKLLLKEALQIHEEDRQMCQAIGEHGSKLVPQKATILTHCNAGALATGGIGTALGVIYTAVSKGKKIKVFADETRPVLQGARLTAWELRKQGIDTTLICDNMAGSLLAAGEIALVIVGADRIAKNLDFANKIGTYPLAVLAKEHKAPFYVAAPSSTFDKSIPNGSKIVIEQREESEVLQSGKGKINIRGLKVYNPAFDVTPASLVSAVITEKGIIRGKRK
ncbi:MAG: methylthioribose-1-phosphate isomerase [candidate division Zixibacteria bacterium DG_27]|nr:MAG: methylthioribose-1-phosphate isomerase [candidate division Zixibacteria bacterium DG_27]